jgi:5-methylcytosine-specific restriction endonuclease McrA
VGRRNDPRGQASFVASPLDTHFCPKIIFMRCCTKCGVEKLLSEFYKGRPDCKVCKNAQSVKNTRVRRKNPDYIARHRKWRIEYVAKNKGRLAEQRKAWLKTPSGQAWHRLSNRARKARLRSSIGGVSAHCAALLERQRWRCAACRVSLRDGKHLDHIIPLAAGGGHEAGNFQWLCPPCNRAKAAKHPVEFMQSRGFLI